MPCWTPRFFVISSNLKTTNTRSVVFLAAVPHPVYLSPLDPLLGSAKGARKGPLALWHKVNADGLFRPSSSWRGQRSGVEPCFCDAGPGSKAKPSAPRHMDWSPETSLGGRRGDGLRIDREAQAEIPIPLFAPVKSAVQTSQSSFNPNPTWFQRRSQLRGGWGRRPQIRGWRAGGSLAVASSTPASPLLSPAEIRELNHAAFVSLSYPTDRQVLRNPHIGRPGFLVSMTLHPRTALRRGRHAGLLLTPNCQRWSARSRHT